MKTKQIIASIFLGSLFLTSCGGWTEEDKRNFMDACEKKSGRPYCDCTLEKMMSKFDTFADIQKDQAAMAEILSDEECLGLEE
jgi:hypothetical protein